MIEPHAINDNLFICCKQGFSYGILLGIEDIPNTDDSDDSPDKLYHFISADHLTKFSVKLSEIEILEKAYLPVKIINNEVFDSLEAAIRFARRFESYNIPARIVEYHDQEITVLYKTGDPIEVPPYIAPGNIEFYHYSDPQAPQYTWPFVYIHGKAEHDNDILCQQNGWEWNAPDLILSNVPIPEEPGEYKGTLYGRPVIAVLAYRHHFMGGRVAYKDDPVGLGHAKNIDAWR